MAIALKKFGTWLMKPLFWHLRRRGVFVVYWVVNSKQEFDSVRKYPADAWLTDRPQLLREYWDEESGVQKMDSSDSLGNDN